jgi:hypothetical protein
MRRFASLTGLTVAVFLSACAGQSISIGTPNISLFDNTSDPEQTSSISKHSSQPQSKQTEVAAANKAKAASRRGRKATKTNKRSKTKVAQTSDAKKQVVREKRPTQKKSGSVLGNVFASNTSVSDRVETNKSTVETYSMLAQQIRACWLKPSKPLLPNHGFYAEMSPKKPDTAKIILYKKEPNNRRGLQAFRIMIEGGFGGTTIISKNRRVSADLEATFKSDIARWAKGDTNCKQ